MTTLTIDDHGKTRRISFDIGDIPALKQILAELKQLKADQNPRHHAHPYSWEMPLESPNKPTTPPEPTSNPTESTYPAKNASGMARNSDPHTSHAAAASINATRSEQEVVDALRRLGGSGINAAIAAEMGITQIGSISPRLKPLREKGRVRWSGKTLPGPSGRQMRVWELV